MNVTKWWGLLKTRALWFKKKTSFIQKKILDKSFKNSRGALRWNKYFFQKLSPIFSKIVVTLMFLESAWQIGTTLGMIGDIFWEKTITSRTSYLYYVACALPKNCYKLTVHGHLKRIKWSNPMKYFSKPSPSSTSNGWLS